MSENSRSLLNTSMFENTRLGHWHLQHRCNLGVLGLSFSTHSRILFSSEYFHYKISIHGKCLENKNDKFSRSGIIDARAGYRAAARRLRNTALAVSKSYRSKTTQNCVDYRQLTITRASIKVDRTDVKQVVNVGNGWSWLWIMSSGTGLLSAVLNFQVLPRPW
jgi:hypothetical protein